MVSCKVNNKARKGERTVCLGRQGCCFKHCGQGRPQKEDDPGKK